MDCSILFTEKHPQRINRYIYRICRLSIIAVEDIGIANIPLIHDFLKTEIRKDNINDMGGKNYVLSIVDLMAKSPKDTIRSEKVLII